MLCQGCSSAASQRDSWVHPHGLVSYTEAAAREAGPTEDTSVFLLPACLISCLIWYLLQREPTVEYGLLNLFGYHFQLNPWSHCQLGRAGITAYVWVSECHARTRNYIYLHISRAWAVREFYGKGLSSSLMVFTLELEPCQTLRSEKMVPSSHRHVRPCWHELMSIHLPRLRLRCVPISPRTVAHHLPIDRSLALVHSDQNCTHLLESAAVDRHHSCFVWDSLVRS